jgi:Na+-transporting NADH:ubiquinone oxidoreductase subunit F
MIFLRKLHKWLGLVIGAQLIIWLLSGMLISFIDQQKVSGGITRQAPNDALSAASRGALFPASQLPLTIKSVQSITLNSFLSKPVYRVVQSDASLMFDAQTGKKLYIDQPLAERIALDSYRGVGELLNSERLQQGSDEVRDFSGPVWRINIDDPLVTRIYVSADDGQVLAHRNSRWALVDFLLMLHFMDYLRADDFNNPQIIAVGFGTLWIAISGLLLVFYSFSRSDFLWLPGMKSSGRRVNGTVKSVGQAEQQLALDSSLSYYASLSQHDIRLPSNCDGSGSCGLCRVHYENNVPEHTAVDREWIDSAALSDGARLGCQHRPRSNDVVVVPEIAFQQGSQWGEVLSSRWLTPLLKEIRLRPDVFLHFTPGDYLQFQIPACEISLQQLTVPESFSAVWDALSLPDSWSYTNAQDQTRTYSVATEPTLEQPQELVFTVRFFPPPAGTELLPGIGSSYLCSLKVGDRVAFRGPAGDFRLLESEREKILIGGGAGMAPLKSMTLHLLRNEGWRGKLRFWYGARNQREILYREVLESLAQEHANFEWEVALSDAGDDRQWQGNKGFIHEAIFEKVLKDHPELQNCEFYLCGPPAMLAATRQMLRKLGIEDQFVLFDDFGN